MTGSGQFSQVTYRFSCFQFALFALSRSLGIVHIYGWEACMPLSTKNRHRIAAGLGIVFMAFIGAGKGDDTHPAHIPDSIREITAQTRKHWKPDAVLAALLLERERGDSAFRYDYVFRSSDEARLYHVKRGAEGDSTEFRNFTNEPNAQGALPSGILDLPKAEGVARAQGMKGSMIAAELFAWEAQPGQRVAVWRLTAEKNQKSYYVDAFTGALYDAENADMAEVKRGQESMQAAADEDRKNFIGSPH
jgi:hypothetical protein